MFNLRLVLLISFLLNVDNSFAQKKDDSKTENRAKETNTPIAKDTKVEVNKELNKEAGKEAPGTLIDKIALVINDQTYALSDFANVQKNYSARSEVAPIVYAPGKNNPKDLTQIFIQIFIVRQKLKDIGYAISDDVVDERIRYIEKAQGLNRADLNNFLKSKSLDFDTYFQLIKESIELTQYLQKIVYPTIDISDLEIKNFFLKNFPSYNEKSIKYDLIAITIPPSVEAAVPLKEIISHIKAYRDGIALPAKLKDIESYKMDKVDDSALAQNIASVLKKTEIGQYTEIIKVQKKSTLFFIENKEFSSSSVFDTEKEKIRMQLAFEKAQFVLEDWINSEVKNYYISKNI